MKKYMVKTYFTYKYPEEDTTPRWYLDAWLMAFFIELYDPNARCEIVET